MGTTTSDIDLREGEPSVEQRVKDLHDFDLEHLKNRILSPKGSRYFLTFDVRHADSLGWLTQTNSALSPEESHLAASLLIALVQWVVEKPTVVDDEPEVYLRRWGVEAMTTMRTSSEERLPPEEYHQPEGGFLPMHLVVASAFQALGREEFAVSFSKVREPVKPEPLYVRNASEAHKRLHALTLQGVQKLRDRTLNEGVRYYVTFDPRHEEVAAWLAHNLIPGTKAKSGFVASFIVALIEWAQAESPVLVAEGYLRQWGVETRIHSHAIGEPLSSPSVHPLRGFLPLEVCIISAFHERGCAHWADVFRSDVPVERMTSGEETGILDKPIVHFPELEEENYAENTIDGGEVVDGPTQKQRDEELHLAVGPALDTSALDDFLANEDEELEARRERNVARVEALCKLYSGKYPPDGFDNQALATKLTQAARAAGKAFRCFGDDGTAGPCELPPATAIEFNKGRYRFLHRPKDGRQKHKYDLDGGASIRTGRLRIPPLELVDTPS